MQADVEEDRMFLALVKGATAVEEATLSEELRDMEGKPYDAKEAAQQSVSVLESVRGHDVSVAVADACNRLALILVSSAPVYRFADAAKPSVPICTIHSIGRAGGMRSLKATCANRAHGRCVCWITKDTSDTMVHRSLLLEMMQWAAEGRTASENQHYGAAIAIKRRYGMKV